MPNRSYLDTAEDPAIGRLSRGCSRMSVGADRRIRFVHATAAADGVAVGDLFMDDLYQWPEVAARLVPQK
jgi:hypothetical protein